jgi:hypothetical protein
MSENLYKMVERLAQADHRSLADMFRSICRSWLEDHGQIERHSEPIYYSPLLPDEQRELGVPVHARVTFKEYLSRYFLRTKIRRARLQSFPYGPLRSFFQTYELLKISSSAIKKYQGHRLKQGVKPAVLKREVRCLGKILDKAVQDGYLRRNPVRSMKLLK